MAISVQENARTSRKGVVQMGRGRGPGYYDEGGVWVSTAGLERAVRQAENRRGRRRGGWTPRTVGSMADGTEVTFRQGTGDNEGHTLISDGEKSARQFDARLTTTTAPTVRMTATLTVTAVTTLARATDLHVLSRDANSTHFHI